MARLPSRKVAPPREELGRHSADLGDTVTRKVCYPYAGAIKQDSVWFFCDSIFAHERAVPGPQPGNTTVGNGRGPDVPAVKGEAGRTLPDWEGALDCGVAGAYCGDGAIVLVYDPYLRAIESETIRELADGNGAEQGAIARTQFGDSVPEAIGDPDIASVEENSLWVGADGKCAEDGAIAAEELCYRVGAGIRDPDVGAVPSDALRNQAGNGERTEEHAIASPQLGEGWAAGGIGYPNVGTVKG